MQTIIFTVHSNSFIAWPEYFFVKYHFHFFELFLYNITTHSITYMWENYCMLGPIYVINETSLLQILNRILSVHNASCISYTVECWFIPLFVNISNNLANPWPGGVHRRNSLSNLEWLVWKSSVGNFVRLFLQENVKIWAFNKKVNNWGCFKITFRLSNQL